MDYKVQLSNEQIRLLIDKYINSTEAQEWVNKRWEDHKRWKEWIDPEKIDDLSDDELKTKFFEYYNEGAGRHPFDARWRDKITEDMAKFRETLKFLLDESIPLEHRLNEVLNGDGKHHIKGMGKALVTSLLMDLNLDKYSTWNGKTEIGLKVLGLMPNFGTSNSYEKYQMVMNALTQIRNIKPDISFLEIDHLEHIIFAEEDAKKVIREFCADNLLNLLKIVPDIYSRLQAEVDGDNKNEIRTEISSLFDAFSEYLKRIAGVDITKYEFNKGIGLGALANCPWFAIFDKKVTKTAQEGFYPVFLFSEDKKVVSLSLNQGITIIGNYYEFLRNQSPTRVNVKENVLGELKSRTAYFRSVLGDQTQNFNAKIELTASKNQLCEYYENGNICAKEYDLDNLPSGIELLGDLDEIIRLYEVLVEDYLDITDLKIEEDEKEISKANFVFDYKFKKLKHEIIEINEDGQTYEILWSNKENIWTHFCVEDDKYSNRFGVEKPEQNNLEQQEIYEIKFPKKDINREIPYAIAKNKAGNNFLILRNLSETKDCEMFTLNGYFKDRQLGVEDGTEKSKVTFVTGISDSNLTNNLKQFLMEVSNINQKAKESFVEFIKEIYNEEIKIALLELQRGKNILFYGPPGSGKTLLSKIISQDYLDNEDAYLLYTVHSGTDYYDLVARIVPDVDDTNGLIYSKEKRFLLDALLSEKILILDEINRTQIDTALGVFFTYLEKEHRVKDSEQIKKIIKNETNVNDEDLDNLETKLENFRILGTLNIYDKTFLFKLGDALKRRFRFIEITTKNETLNMLKDNDGFKRCFIRSCGYNEDLDERKLNILNQIIDIFSEINDIKPLGIGILKETLLVSTYPDLEDPVDYTIASLIVPFFENDLNYSSILSILNKHELTDSVNKLKSLNFNISDMNGI